MTANFLSKAFNSLLLILSLTIFINLPVNANTKVKEQEMPSPLIVKASLNSEISVNNDPKIKKEIIEQFSKNRGNNRKLNSKYPTSSILWPIELDLKGLEIQEPSKILHPSLIGECVASDTEERIICRIHTLRYIMDRHFIEKSVQGWIIDKDGGNGFKGNVEKNTKAFVFDDKGYPSFNGKVGFFNKLFNKYPTLTRKPVDGEEIDIVLILKEDISPALFPSYEEPKPQMYFPNKKQNIQQVQPQSLRSSIPFFPFPYYLIVLFLVPSMGYIIFKWK
jgi:hypothetical protein